MAQLPTQQQDSETVRRIYTLHEQRNAEPDRPYLGASSIGNECERALWYGFRWATRAKHAGRVLRLFETGHREEDRMLAELRAIGVEVYERDPRSGQQFGFSEPSAGHHLRGHLDGLARKVPEAPKAHHVIECKTHGKKSFADLKAKGVEKSKPTHFAQMMLYMHWTREAWGAKHGCDRALYLAVCKDTDELYAERIRFDPEAAGHLIAKAQRVIFTAAPPARISDDPEWYVCKFCPHHAICHDGAVPRATCRTCAHATPEREGDARWSCVINGSNDIPTEFQREAHACHRFIPPLVEKHFELFNWQAPNIVTWINRANGQQFTQPDWTSQEMHAAQDKRAIGDTDINEFRQAFDARVAA